ncbi:MAG: flagellar biosynthesis anti-sigma factor FlgM [Phycisphaerae bacterium]|nr:flagellar biosynthesis anti-sigma factor FlgM [Phycisphaerae bacterium]
MTNIQGIGQGAVPAIQPTAQASQSAYTASPQAIGDTIEISSVARLTAAVHTLPDVRAELVERVKADIAAGTYETPDRIDVALERLMDDMTGVL